MYYYKISDNGRFVGYMKSTVKQNDKAEISEEEFCNAVKDKNTVIESEE